MNRYNNEKTLSDLVQESSLFGNSAGLEGNYAARSRCGSSISFDRIGNHLFTTSLPRERYLAPDENELVSLLRPNVCPLMGITDIRENGSTMNALPNEMEDIRLLLLERRRYLSEYISLTSRASSDDLFGSSLDILASASRTSTMAPTSSLLASDGVLVNDDLLAILERKRIRELNEYLLSRLESICEKEQRMGLSRSAFMSKLPLTNLLSSKSRCIDEIGMGMDTTSVRPHRLPLSTSISARDVLLGSSSGLNPLVNHSRCPVGQNTLNTDLNDTTTFVAVAKKRKTIVLFMACDEDSLSEYQCLIRKQMELFEAEHMLQSDGKRKKAMAAGHVGIRCRHCSHLTPSKRTKGSMFFPTKLERIYQAAQNLAVFHLKEGCNHVPRDVRRKIGLLRERKSPAGGGKRYWAEGVRARGVGETPSGLRFLS